VTLQDRSYGLAACIPRPFHTCRRLTQSTIAAFCRHQSPGSAYQPVTCYLL